MSRYLLDTNIISYLQTDGKLSTKILNRLQSLSQEDEVSVSIIVLYELAYGQGDLSDTTQAEAVRQGIEFIKEYLMIVPLDTKEVDVFAEIKMRYKHATGITSNALKRHNLDLLIASTAIATNATLVSNDMIFKQLSKIDPRLRYENWLL